MENKDKDVAASSSSLRIEMKNINRVTLRHRLKPKVQLNEVTTTNEDDTVYNLPQAPPPFKYILKPKAIFVLDKASLIPGFVGVKWKILNATQDKHFLLKHHRDPDDYMPDIVYKAVRKILDSPLNKAGMVGAVYVKIDHGMLFEIKPWARLPRTLYRFCGIILELMQKSSEPIRTKHTGEVIIQAIEGPVTRHLPANSRLIGISNVFQERVDINDYVASAADDLNLVFVVGTSLDGDIKELLVDDAISVSKFRVPPRISLGAICYALQRKWNIF